MRCDCSFCMRNTQFCSSTSHTGYPDLPPYIIPITPNEKHIHLQWMMHRASDCIERQIAWDDTAYNTPPLRCYRSVYTTAGSALSQTAAVSLVVV